MSFGSAQATPIRQELQKPDPEASIPKAAFVAAKTASDKLGANTVLLAMGEALGVVDAFVITSGRNTRQVNTIAEEIEAVVKETCHEAPYAVEGKNDASWILMDYGDFIVHIFFEETREYYDLEHLWSVAPRIDLESYFQAT